MLRGLVSLGRRPLIRPACPSVRSLSAATGDGQDAETLSEIRLAVEQLCEGFPGEYWRDLDAHKAYPTEFVQTLTKSGFLSVLVPEQYGGGGLGLQAGCTVLETIHRSGCNAGAAHAQMYTMGSLLRHGTDAQRQEWLPAIASGELRLQAFGVSEPNSGSDTLSLQTTATRDGDDFIINGSKMWTSRAEHSDLMLILARTKPEAPRDQPRERAGALTLFLADLRGRVHMDRPDAPPITASESMGRMSISPVATMMNHSTTATFFDNLRVRACDIIGAEGRGFHVVIDSMNAERVLIASECIGDGRWFVNKASEYASERSVFGRPIGANQGVQFPIADAHMAVEAAGLMVDKAAAMFDSGVPCGAEANMAKHLAAEASWQAGDTCVQTFGGFGFAQEYDVERKFRETRLYRVAPISSNLVRSFVADKVLGMPKSY